MTDPILGAVDGNPTTEVRLHVPRVGPWWADVVMVEDPDLSGRVSIQLGALVLSGTVDPRYTGSRGFQRFARIVGGAGGWGSLVRPRAYQTDSGVRALVVAEDVAREVGETLAEFSPDAERLGAFYVRQAGTASRVLEEAAGGAEWWVDYQGATRVGSRPSVAVDAAAAEILEFDPLARVVTLAADDLGAVGIGAVLSGELLEEPVTVSELEILVDQDTARIRAWCPREATRGRIAGALRRIVDRATDGRLWGRWRYRVVRMSGDRVELQAISRAAGLPDVLPVAMFPGIAGFHAELTPGTEVRVEFVEGDRRMPEIVGFAGKGGPGFVPVKLTLASAGTPPAAARNGDPVRVTIPIGVVTGLVANLSTGAISATSPVVIDGTITGGSAKVGIG